MPCVSVVMLCYVINCYTLASVCVTTVSLNKPWYAKAMMAGSGSRVIGPALPLPVVIYTPCAVLKKQLDGGYYSTINNKLYFTLDGEYSNTPLTYGSNYSVYDYKRILQSVTIDNNKLNNGDNRYQLNVSSLPTGYYVLEVSNQKKEKLMLRFKK